MEDDEKIGKSGRVYENERSGEKDGARGEEESK